MECMWGCGQNGVFPCTSFYGKRDGLMKCAERWQLCPAKEKTKKDAGKKLKQHLTNVDLSERMAKRKATLQKIGEDGISGFRRNALAVAASRREPDGSFRGTERMVKTKRSKKNERGQDIYMQAAIKTAIKRFGTYAGLKDKPEFKIYRYYVDRITKMQPLHTLKNFEKRAGYGKSKDPYQVDHKFSVVQGFLNNIPPYIIGHISNLEMLPSEKNNSKGSGCSITKEALFEGFFTSITKIGRTG